MKNVTITLDEDVAQWARVFAAKNNTSVSQLLGQILKEKMAQENEYGTQQGASSKTRRAL